MASSLPYIFKLVRWLFRLFYRRS